MKPISDLTVLVSDHGLFLPVAKRMAKDCKRVLYQYPSSIKGFPSLSSCIIGDGFENIERVEEIWPYLNEVDLFIFSDISQSGLQLYLESIGKKVWGSRAGDTLELNRHKFLKVLAEIGLPVPEQTTVKGLAKLREYLRDKTDKFIKISKYRADMETAHWRDYDLDSGWLDSLAVKFGPAQDLIPFMVFEPIDAPVEVGGDTYCVDGQWPSIMLHGDEAKDKCYFGAVTKREDMPAELQDIMEAFSPVLKDFRYRNEWSMETRDGKYIDPTCRGGLPSTASQLNTWSNFPEIVWAGANGELVEPVPAYQFSAECILTLKGKKDEWGKTRVEGEVAEACHFASCCEIDGAICFPPDGHEGDDVGWLQAGGDTMEEAIENMKKLAEDLPDGLTAATEDLVGLLAKIKEGEEAGIQFTDQTVPEPETAVT
jgi:hypothetical protein